MGNVCPPLAETLHAHALEQCFTRRDGPDWFPVICNTRADVPYGNSVPVEGDDDPEILPVSLAMQMVRSGSKFFSVIQWT